MLCTCFSANGAILILAWGNAPGLRQKFTSADSAIHLRVFFGNYSAMPQSLSERLFDSRFQRSLWGKLFPGALPQLA
jgi:hypothetical protein